VGRHAALKRCCQANARLRPAPGCPDDADSLLRPLWFPRRSHTQPASFCSRSSTAPRYESIIGSPGHENDSQALTDPLTIWSLAPFDRFVLNQQNWRHLKLGKELDPSA
jgi:hypothetical protein